MMFIAWWNSLTGLQQLLACGALPATLLLLIQTILLLFGVGGGGHDADHGELPADSVSEPGGAPDAAAPDSQLQDGVPDGEAADMGHDGAHHLEGVRIFTIRGIVAFVAVGGWLGIAMVDLGLSGAWASVIAFFGGTLALLAVAWILKWSLSLQESGTLNPQNAIAHIGTVYITIPPKRSGSGKVNLTVQEQLVELDAVTDSEYPIKPNTQVQVVGLSGKTTLVVRSLADDNRSKSLF